MPIVSVELDNELRSMGKTHKDIDFLKIEIPRRGESYKVTYDSETDTELYIPYKLYDDGFGTQELFGVVVFKDGTWLERSEYDGVESWEYKELPTRSDPTI